MGRNGICVRSGGRFFRSAVGTGAYAQGTKGAIRPAIPGERIRSLPGSTMERR